ncbi:MAG: C25 family cysteine peptidase [Chloroflexota bacterium]
MSTSSESIALNGINAVTGEYGLTLTEEKLASFAFGHTNADEGSKQRGTYADAANYAAEMEKTYRGVKEGVDATDLSQAGWGILFASADPQAQAIQEALQPLWLLRQKQAGIHFRLFTGRDGYRLGETKHDFLKRFFVHTGPVDPAKGLPYYLLLIGSPDLIPFEFQYQLDVQFAVGRLDFDTVEAYGHYAQSVVAAEEGDVELARTATFFNVTHEDDRPTKSADQFLVQPLAKHLTEAFSDWTVETLQGADATRSQLESILGGRQKPAFLFTSSHGIDFPMGHPKQEQQQGALLCQEWPGPRKWQAGQPLTEEFYFAGDHLSSTAKPQGLVAFHFACYGGGTPEYFNFASQNARDAHPIAERPFVANLPKKLLGHPNGGALAVVSHIDRVWSNSYQQDQTSQTTTFESTLERILNGAPLGFALEFFNERYAELATDLNAKLASIGPGTNLPPKQMAKLWRESNDARNFVLLGDPAVRVAVPQKVHRGPISSIPALKNRPYPPTSPSVKIHADGRPDTIPHDSWIQTPLLVQNAYRNVLAEVEQLGQQLEAAQKEIARLAKLVTNRNGRKIPDDELDGERPMSAIRDGGLRDGRLRDGGLRESRTRGGGMRGGANSSGKPHPNTTPSFTPRSANNEQEDD